MKTSVIVVRQDLNGIVVRQETKTSFFNANDLLEIYNKRTKENKRLQHYMENVNTKKLKEAIVLDFQNSNNSGELEKGVVYSKTGKFGGTWMHPYLFLDFAMWLSVDFKLTAIKWIYDNVIKLRIDSGDGYNEVNQALFELQPNSPHFTYSNEAKMINKLVFGKPDKGQRDTATEKQLELLKFLQKADVKFIQQKLDYYDRYEELKKLKDIFN